MKKRRKTKRKQRQQKRKRRSPWYRAKRMSHRASVKKRPFIDRHPGREACSGSDKGRQSVDHGTAAPARTATERDMVVYCLPLQRRKYFATVWYFQKATASADPFLDAVSSPVGKDAFRFSPSYTEQRTISPVAVHASQEMLWLRTAVQQVEQPRLLLRLQRLLVARRISSLCVIRHSRRNLV